MSKLNSSSSEIKPGVSSITEKTQALTLKPTTEIAILSTMDAADTNPEIRLHSDRVRVNVKKSQARQISWYFLEEFLTNGDNADFFMIQPAQRYRGILEDVNQIFNYGIETLVILDDQHAAQLSGLVDMFGLQTLTALLQHRSDNNPANSNP
ncbi:hypothetical protein HDE_04599 [Halotydeus destructor]|nr:hypothetical protein HDE_04599 [Halotydeus destructor]